MAMLHPYHGTGSPKNPEEIPRRSRSWLVCKHFRNGRRLFSSHDISGEIPTVTLTPPPRWPPLTSSCLPLVSGLTDSKTADKIVDPAGMFESQLTHWHTPRHTSTSRWFLKDASGSGATSCVVLAPLPALWDVGLRFPKILIRTLRDSLPATEKQKNPRLIPYQIRRK